MKKTATLLILCILFAGKIFAQTPILTPSGPIIPNYYPWIATNKVLVNDENTLLSHHVADGPISMFKKVNLEHLIAYSKDTKKVITQELIIPNVKEMEHIFTKKVGDEVMIFYGEQPKKSSQFIVQTTMLPQDISVGKINVKLETLFSFNIGDKESVSYYTATSPNRLKHAFLFLILDKKKTIRKFMVMVFDEKGEVLWQESYSPDFSDKEVIIHDFKLDDHGKTLLLVAASSGKRRDIPDLQLMSFHENEQTSMNVEIFEEKIQDMRMLILSNETYFVGGYYSEKKGTTVGYFSMVFDPGSETLLYKNFSKFKNDYNEKGLFGWGGKLAYVNQVYDVSCNYLFELPNGSIAMLGEQNYAYAVTDSKGLTTYRYFKKHIFCHKFALDGAKIDYEMIKRSQALVSGVPLYGNLSKVGLSFSAFTKGNNVYLLYNDNVKNHNGKSKNWVTVILNQPKTVCTILASIKEDEKTKLRVVMLPTKDKRVFNRLWAFDGERVFIGVMSPKLYFLEQFELPE